MKKLINNMTKEDLQKKKIPDAPGVYFFLDARKKILYIGKATSLTHRVKSYFDGAIREKRSPVIEKMVAATKNIEWTVTDSVLEAMLIETNLIRIHKPEYNTRSKDDKSFNHVVITREEFPRVLVVRGKDLINANIDHEYTHLYGPFPNGTQFKEALKIIRKLFQFYDGAIELGDAKNKYYQRKIDFNRQIGLYPERTTAREYKKTIAHIILFFEGEKARILTDLEKQMHRYAKNEEFEKAGDCKRKIFALKHIQDVSLIKDESRVYRDENKIRIEAYDIAHMFGENMVGVMTVIEAGESQPNEYRKFIIRSCTGANDTKALQEVLERRFAHTEWEMPNMLVVDGSVAQKRVAEKVLRQCAFHIPVVGVVKDEKHKPIRIIGEKNIVKKYAHEILLANAESHRFAITFHRKKRNILESVLKSTNSRRKVEGV